MHYGNLQTPANVCRCKPSDQIRSVRQCGASGDKGAMCLCMALNAFEKFNFHFYLTFDSMPIYLDIYLVNDTRYFVLRKNFYEIHYSF